MEARMPIIHEIQAIIFDEQPYLFFMSGGGVFTWQNHGKPAKDRWLTGVTDGFDQYHPLFNRTPLLWHFERQ